MDETHITISCRASCPHGVLYRDVALRFAPKGHHVKAWGNAPGKSRGKGNALKGRNEDATTFRPVEDFGCAQMWTRSVAFDRPFIRAITPQN